MTALINCIHCISHDTIEKGLHSNLRRSNYYYNPMMIELSSLQIVWLHTISHQMTKFLVDYAPPILYSSHLIANYCWLVWWGKNPLLITLDLSLNYLFPHSCSVTCYSIWDIFNLFKSIFYDRSETDIVL